MLKIGLEIFSRFGKKLEAKESLKNKKIKGRSCIYYKEQKTQFIGVNLRVQVKKVYLNEFGASEASFVMKFLGEK